MIAVARHPKFWVRAIIGVLLAQCLAFAAEQGQLVGKVVGVHDGDTLTLLVGRTQYKIRLDGIDAPELGQDFGST